MLRPWVSSCVVSLLHTHNTLMSIHGSTADKWRSDGAPAYFPLLGMLFSATVDMSKSV